MVEELRHPVASPYSLAPSTKMATPLSLMSRQESTLSTAKLRNNPMGGVRCKAFSIIRWKNRLLLWTAFINQSIRLSHRGLLPHRGRRSK